VKKGFDKVLKLGCYVLLILVLFIPACAVKLVDINESILKLNLSKEQRTVVEPKMMAIKVIADKYEDEKKQFEEKVKNAMEGFKSRETTSNSDRSDNRSERQQAFQGIRAEQEEFFKRREAYISAIKIHESDIKAVLNEKQLATFEKMKLPELKAPELPEAGRQPEGGGRRGRGSGGGRRGGIGANGDGGMF
jgi:hypothetical protein